jgi:hypothetical protein
VWFDPATLGRPNFFSPFYVSWAGFRLRAIHFVQLIDIPIERGSGEQFRCRAAVDFDGERVASEFGLVGQRQDCGKEEAL